MPTDYTPAGRVGNLIVRGRTLRRDVAEDVLDGEVQLTTDQVSQLTLSLADADDALLASRLFDTGGQADYADLKLEVAAIGATVTSGVNTIDVTARSLGAQKMRRAKGKLVERNVSPTTYMARRAKTAGLTFLGEPSAKRNTIIRGLGKTPADHESDWATGQRLAGELGFIAFEAAGRYYFGRPTWLLANVAAVNINLNTPGLASRPVCRRTADDPGGRVATIDLEVDDELIKLRPGMAVVLAGVPTFDGRYLVTSVTIPLDDEAPVTAQAETAVNPKPEGEGGAAAAGMPQPGDLGFGPGGANPNATASQFVSYAVAQAGDRYIFGAETKLTDPDPDAFDCSELVQWAAAQAGVTIPDGASNQLDYCDRKRTAITVDAAIATRGALLFGGYYYSAGLSKITHVAISLGDGRTIEAVNRTYGVRMMSARGRTSITWIAGARVPGLAYAGPKSNNDYSRAPVI